MTKRMAARTAVMVLSIFLSVGWLMEVGHLNLRTEGKPNNREVTMNEKDLELHKQAERTCLMRAQAAKELTIRCMTVARHYGVDHQLKKLRGMLGERLWDRVQYRSVFLPLHGASVRKRYRSVDELVTEN